MNSFKGISTTVISSWVGVIISESIAFNDKVIGYAIFSLLKYSSEKLGSTLSNK